MKILFAADGSLQSLAALETLVRSFAYFRETPSLTLLCVHPPLPYRGAAAAAAGQAAVQRYYDEENAAALAGARELLTARNIAFEAETRIGTPAEEIVNRAEEGGFTMIAMGTHGHTALANLVMGSVSTGVVARSKVPVLLLK
jgi:nucleotide-binding universal stress UspA family protein